jgi:hypothetical protein
MQEAEGCAPSYRLICWFQSLTSDPGDKSIAAHISAPGGPRADLEISYFRRSLRAGLEESFYDRGEEKLDQMASVVVSLLTLYFLPTEVICQSLRVGGASRASQPSAGDPATLRRRRPCAGSQCDVVNFFLPRGAQSE